MMVDRILALDMRYDGDVKGKREQNLNEDIAMRSHFKKLFAKKIALSKMSPTNEDNWVIAI